MQSAIFRQDTLSLRRHFPFVVMKALNSKQKTGLWMGIAMAIAMGVNPPWVEGGPGGAPGPYAPIYAPPPSAAGHQPMQIDYSRVLMEWAMAAFLTVGMVM